MRCDKVINGREATRIYYLEDRSAAFSMFLCSFVCYWMGSQSRSKIEIEIYHSPSRNIQDLTGDCLHSVAHGHTIGMRKQSSFTLNFCSMSTYMK